MSDQEDFDQDLTSSQEHTIAFVVILLFGAMYLFFMKGCQPLTSSINQAFGPAQSAQVSPDQSHPQSVSNQHMAKASGDSADQRDVIDTSSEEGGQVAANDAAQGATKQSLADVEGATTNNNPDGNNSQQAQLAAQQAAKAKDAARIKAEAASLAAATAAQRLADEKRFQEKQAELQAGKAELAIPAKPTANQADDALSQQQPAQAANQISETNNQSASQQPFDMDKELARVDFTLPDGRSIQIQKQGLESRFKQSILQGDSGQPLVFDRVYFFSGSDMLNPESSNQILGIVGIMNTYKDVRIKLRGHTDSSGEVDDNLTLSFKRSLNLKKQLVGLGIDTNRIQVEGLGASEPISDNETEKGRNKNRRIDLTILR